MLHFVQEDFKVNKRVLVVSMNQSLHEYYCSGDFHPLHYHIPWKMLPFFLKTLSENSLTSYQSLWVKIKVTDNSHLLRWEHPSLKHNLMTCTWNPSSIHYSIVGCWSETHTNPIMNYIQDNSVSPSSPWQLVLVLKSLQNDLCSYSNMKKLVFPDGW